MCVDIRCNVSIFRRLSLTHNEAGVLPRSGGGASLVHSGIDECQGTDRQRSAHLGCQRLASFPR